jgi:hypothetical protein
MQWPFHRGKRSVSDRGTAIIDGNNSCRVKYCFLSDSRSYTEIVFKPGSGTGFEAVPGEKQQLDQNRTPIQAGVDGDNESTAWRICQARRRRANLRALSARGLMPIEKIKSRHDQSLHFSFSRSGVLNCTYSREAMVLQRPVLYLQLRSITDSSAFFHFPTEVVRCRHCA